MEFSVTEKLLLANQYEILKRLDPVQTSNYDLLLSCLYNGYLNDFEQLMPHFHKEIDPAVRSEVREILEMFRALHPGAGKVPAAVFAGFDGNEETEHYAYARFLLDERGLWRESKDDGNGYNTHSPVLDDYRAMLSVWDSCADKHNLTSSETASIVEAAPYHSKPK